MLTVEPGKNSSTLFLSESLVVIQSWMFRSDHETPTGIISDIYLKFCKMTTLLQATLFVADIAVEYISGMNIKSAGPTVSLSVPLLKCGRSAYLSPSQLRTPTKSSFSACTILTL